MVTSLHKEVPFFLDIRYLVDIVDQYVNSKMDLTREYSDYELKALIGGCVEKLAKRIPMSLEMREEILLRVFNSKRKLGILQPLLEDVTINEIMINGTDAIFVERNGVMEAVKERFDSKDKLFNLVQNIVSRVNRTVNESNPIVDARLEDGSRINVVLHPVAINGPVVTIRKFSDKPFTMEKLVDIGSITLEEAEFLIKAVRSRMNIFVSGGTSTGKTTFLNVISTYVDKDERIVTIEDSAELMLAHENIVRLETRDKNSEGKGGISMRQLIKASLRMRPDRLIVGEVRDESALDMLVALNSGHDGSMSTGHANSPSDLLVRLETLALWEGNVSSEAIKRQMASGIDLIVHLKRNHLMERKVSEIAEVCGYEDGEVVLNTLFRDGKKVSGLKVKGYKVEGTE
ncbi:MAG TPA: CpaF family protein [Clostridiaceae bacterium]|jgi:pilus assembly protein CpaF|nr:CpaF family protein [Clostridiaceae bacterium]